MSRVKVRELVPTGNDHEGVLIYTVSKTLIDFPSMLLDSCVIHEADIYIAKEVRSNKLEKRKGYQIDTPTIKYMVDRHPVDDEGEETNSWKGN